MKKTYLLSSLLLALFYSNAQNAEAVIIAAKTKYQRLQAEIRTYRIDSMDLPDRSTEGGLATFWCKGKDLKILKAVYFGESGRREWNYYYDSSKLFFVLEKDYTYNSLIYLDAKAAKENHVKAFDPVKTKMEETRYYFYKDKVIRWLDSHNKPVNANTEENKATIAEIIADAYELRNRMLK